MAGPDQRGLWRARAATLALGLAGALLFLAAGLPLPFLLGPLFACLAAALMGAPLRGPGLIGQAFRTILGVAVGSAITPELLGRLPAIALSVALVVPFILLAGVIGYPFFRRLCGFSPPTAFFAAMPGGFQDMVLFGQEAGADMRALSLIHATRLLVILTLVPAVLQFGLDLPLAARPGRGAAEVPLPELGLMVLAALGGWALARRLGLFGASILGPMIATAALSLAGLIQHRPPAEAILAAQLFIAVGIGANYAGLTARELRVDVTAGAAFSLILCLIATLTAALSTALAGMPRLEALLSFSPGGQAEMAVLALVSGADLAVVVAHHVLRITLVILCAPIAARWIDLRG